MANLGKSFFDVHFYLKFQIDKCFGLVKIDVSKRGIKLDQKRYYGSCYVVEITWENW